VWDLYQAYSEALRERDVLDFDDLLVLALTELRARPLERRYAAVIVDEVQDLSRVGVQLLHTLSGDGPDALTLIGDGQQAIYPGGFTLAEAGIDIRGRSTILNVNYRNCAEILRTALAAVDDDEYVDMDESVEQGRRALETARTGGRVDRVHAPEQRSLDHALSSALERIVDEGVRSGDCAVLTHTTTQAHRVTGVLKRAGWTVESLEDYAGRSSEHIKVGTIKRSKGLEFRVVLLPGIVEESPPQRERESDEAYRERCGLRRRELFVGMTRARDHLWLGYLGDPPGGSG
jgi:superfamily I DNA/RNA helicase